MQYPTRGKQCPTGGSIAIPHPVEHEASIWEHPLGSTHGKYEPAFAGPVCSPKNHPASSYPAQPSAVWFRAVVVAYELERVAMAEVAAAQRIPLNTAWNRLRLGREDLRAAARKVTNARH